MHWHAASVLTAALLTSEKGGSICVVLHFAETVRGKFGG